jgi:hypothetical protein
MLNAISGIATMLQVEDPAQVHLDRQREHR